MTVGTLKGYFIATISPHNHKRNFQGFSCIPDFEEIASVIYLQLINLNLNIVNILNVCIYTTSFKI